MDMGISRLALRTRNAWEALDLGVRLWAERKGLYLALWATFFLPLFGVLTLLFWRSPWWIGLLLWWLKPVFEAPVLKILSEQVFVSLPGYRHCVAATWHLLWRPRLLGDLVWRRFSPHRSLLLAVPVLEHLQGSQYRLRRAELTRHGGGAGAWLSFFGIHFEAILTYGLLIVGYWLWFGNPVQDALVQPANMEQVGETLSTLVQVVSRDDVLWPYHLYNLCYALVLCWWGPLYVASGFGLYLHARTLSEAWDIRLATRRLGARLNHPLACALVLGLALVSLGQLPAVRAQALPDVQQVQDNRRAVLEQAPFPHLRSENHYCWRRCDASAPQQSSGSLKNINTASAASSFNVLIYILTALGLVVALWLLWRGCRSRGAGVGCESGRAPETLFGLAVTPESLPDKVSEQVLRLWQHDERAALSLLYRASLAQLPQRFGLTLKDSDTEGEVLQRVHEATPAELGCYWQALTGVWLQLAYGHRVPAAEAVTRLCAAYQRHFEAEGCLKEGADAA